MKRLALATAALAAIAASLVAAGAGSASSTGRTLEFVSVQQRFVQSAPQPRIGDRLVFTDVAYNRTAQFGKPAGARVGASEAVCTVTSNRPPAVQCVLTAHMPDGQLVLGGDGDPAKHVSRWAVLGGIGAYAGARGTAVVTNLSDTKSLVVVHLS